MLLGIQIVGIVFSVFMLYLTYLHFKRREFSSGELGIWITLWVGLIFVTLFPNALDFLVKQVLHLKRPLDFFIIIGFLCMVFITFHNHTLIKKNSYKITSLVQKMATESQEKSKNEDQKLPKK